MQNKIFVVFGASTIITYADQITIHCLIRTFLSAISVDSERTTISQIHVHTLI